MKRTVEQNKRRRDIYAIVKKATGSSKLAAEARDRKVERIIKYSPNVRVREDNRTIYFYIPTPLKRGRLTKVEIEQRRIKKNKIRTEQRRKARDLNYTPAEASKLAGMSKKNFDDIIGNLTILNKSGRAKRWSKMSERYKNGKRKRFDPKIVEQCELINLEHGYPIDSRFGWAVYYFYYVNGGDIEGWATYVDQNPNVPHAVLYGTVNQFNFLAKRKK